MQLRNGRSTGPPPTLTDAITSAAPAAAAPPAAAPAPAPAAPAAPAAPLAAATPSAAAAPPAAPQAPHYDDEVSVAQSRGHRSPTPDGFDVQLAEALDGYDTADEEATSPAAGARSVSAPADEPVDPAATEESAWDWIGEMLAQHEAGDIDRIREINEMGVTFLIIEHNMDLIMKLCSPILVMAEGSIMMQGSPEQVRSDKRLLDAFFGE